VQTATRAFGTLADLVTNTLVSMTGSASDAAGQGGVRGAAALSDSPLLGRLLLDLPAVFDAEVLPRLDPTTRALLGRCGQACRDAMLRSPDLPCAGRIVGLKLDVADFVGSVKLLAWAKTKGCPWRNSLGVTGRHNPCLLAAKGGHLAVLEWAREHGCPWTNERICAGAARGGHLAVLQWARKHGGCSWDRLTSVGAAAGGHLACCSGPGRTAVRGTRGHVHGPRKKGIWRCCSGRR